MRDIDVIDGDKAIFTGFAATLIFVILIVSYSYTKADALSYSFSSPGNSSIDSTSKLAIYFTYSLIGRASFVGSPGGALEDLLGMFVGSYYPDKNLYYAFGMLSGLFAGMVIFDKKKRSLSEAALASLVPAFVIVFFTIIAGMLMAGFLPSSVHLAYPPTAYVLIFSTTYVLTVIGTFSAALIKMKL